jgi:hypothetical protein
MYESCAGVVLPDGDQLLVRITHLYVLTIRPTRSLNLYLPSVTNITHILAA